MQKFVNSLSNDARHDCLAGLELVNKGFPAEKLADLLNTVSKKEFGNVQDGIIKLIDKIDEIRVFCEKTKKVEMLNIINNIIKKMKYDLREIGVEEIPSYGELFNSNLHECLQVVNKPDAQKDEIVEVIRRGYYYNGSVLRNSLVIIGE